MHIQSEIDFTHTRENNPVSQDILDNNRKRLGSQVAKVLRLFVNGKKLTQWGAYSGHSIGDLRRRVLDIEEKFNIRADRTYDAKGVATYCFNDSQKIQGSKILERNK